MEKIEIEEFIEELLKLSDRVDDYVQAKETVNPLMKSFGGSEVVRDTYNDMRTQLNVCKSMYQVLEDEEDDEEEDN